ncbi:diacylglycerol/lipid kinase family protein [Bryobacter aggregatus]|uniref:diacylglycerol/lipid kinase family protein n=1 Tax=Bryobacter aggregatus TaxID=360054 RepID=UPI00068E5162|nr:diacylglycerol kinase family protein [Bryobacter aggregatus]
MTSYLIFNPIAGKLRRNPGLIPAALETLRAQNVSVELLPTTGPGSAAELARRCVREGAAAVYVAGGDGTINEVVNGMAGSQMLLGVLPGGTANCLAVELGIGTDLLRAAKAAGSWKPQRIALGLCTPATGASRYFVAMAGAGFDAQIVRDVDKNVKKKLGKVAYWIAGFGASLRRLPELHVKSSEGESKVSFALASRVRNYGGDLEIAKTIRLSDPKLEMVLFEGRFAVRYMKYLAGVLVNQHRGMSGVHVHLVDKLELSAANGQPIYLQLDGEEFGQLPAQLEIVPDALSILTPVAH